MNFDIDDPRLTAYVLDELNDSERADIEALLAADAEARAYVDSLRDTTALLTEELANQPVPDGLSETQRNAVVEASQKAERPARSTGLLIACAVIPAAAVIAVLVWKADSSTNKGPRVSRRSEAPAGKDIGTRLEEKNAAKERIDRKQTEAGDSTAARSAAHRWRNRRRRVRRRKTNGAVLSDPFMNPGFTGGGYGYRGRAPTTPPDIPHDRDRYDDIKSNDFAAVTTQPLSTFSIDVDTASYSTVRSYLNRDVRPPAGSVRLEEMINYFAYDYPAPKGKHPFSVTTEVSVAPWNREHRLVRIGLRGKQLSRGKDTPKNLVFLIDVSGSMRMANKLPLLKQSLRLLVNSLRPNDRIAMVVYAGASGVVLPSTAARNRTTILNALGRLRAGGSTNGGAGIELAYRIAQKNFVKGGVNRVILATDGDFNVGNTSDAGLVELIKRKAKSNVFLTVLGFGRGNYNDSMLEKLTGHGNGNYAYIDTLGEARKVFVEQLSSTLVTIAKDVKIQIEFNPKHVASYRLIGYENRKLAARDFNDDKKDAGEIGANHRVTALYELIPRGAKHSAATGVDALKYQKSAPSAAANSNELFTIKLRYKPPEGSTSKLMKHTVANTAIELNRTSPDFKLAAAVAAFGMLLRNSSHKGNASYDTAIRLATVAASKRDPYGYRAELIALIKRAKTIPR